MAFAKSSMYLRPLQKLEGDFEFWWINLCAMCEALYFFLAPSLGPCALRYPGVVERPHSLDEAQGRGGQRKGECQEEETDDEHV